MEHRLFAGNERVYSFQKGRRVYDIRSGEFIMTEQTRPFLKKLPAGETFNHVPQSYYGVAQLGKMERYLFTPAITVSVGVTFYHKLTSLAALAHIDNQDPWLSVLYIVEHLHRLGAPAEQWVARVIGGQDGQSEKAIHEIVKALDESKMPISELDILGKDNYRELIFDSKDGIVYENQLEVPDYRALMTHVDAHTVREIGAPIILYNKGPRGF